MESVTERAIDSLVTSPFMVGKSDRGILMAYTVNKLAKLSGVSIRTLRFYDEVGLLKPAYYGENNYRYYEEEQLLMLQQILFFRELGFSLAEIQRIVKSSDFDKIESLNSHRQVLIKNIDRTTVLINTIDKTISHLRGKTEMKVEELYYGFDSAKQKKYEQDLVDSGKVTQSEMNEYRKKYQNMTREQREELHQKFIEDGRQINLDLISAIDNKLLPSSDKVQEIMRRHHAWVGWNPTKEKYIGLSQLYQTPEFKKFYDAHDLRLLTFIVEAMTIFAERKLS